jgi:hypothetical protein
MGTALSPAQDVPCGRFCTQSKRSAAQPVACWSCRVSSIHAGKAQWETQISWRIDGRWLRLGHRLGSDVTISFQGPSVDPRHGSEY